MQSHYIISSLWQYFVAHLTHSLDSGLASLQKLVLLLVHIPTAERLMHGYVLSPYLPVINTHSVSLNPKDSTETNVEFVALSKRMNRAAQQHQIQSVQPEAVHLVLQALEKHLARVISAVYPQVCAYALFNCLHAFLFLSPALTNLSH